MKLRLIAVIVLAVALAACASGPVVTRTAPQVAPASPASGSTSEVRRCVTGAGVVVRITQTGTASAGDQAANHGGVLASVLGDPTTSGQAHTGSGAVAGAGSTPKKAGPGYDIYVRMDDGQRIILNQRDLVGIVEGSHVAVENCKAHVQH